MVGSYTLDKSIGGLVVGLIILSLTVDVSRGDRVGLVPGAMVPNIDLSVLGVIV